MFISLFRFVNLANARHREIHSLHGDMIKMNNKLILENSLASKLRKDLEHEKIVFEERKTVFFLSIYEIYIAPLQGSYLQGNYSEALICMRFVLLSCFYRNSR